MINKYFCWGINRKS